MLHESRWQSINAKVVSLVFCLLASVEGTKVRLEIPLQSPPSPKGGDRHFVTAPPPPEGETSACYVSVSNEVVDKLLSCLSFPSKGWSPPLDQE